MADPGRVGARPRLPRRHRPPRLDLPSPLRLPDRELPEVRAGSDCERCRPGWVTQPVNTVSSLAYVVAGGLTLDEARRRPERARPGSRAVGWSLVAAGLGSVAYHGPGGVAGRWAHDASLLAMVGLVALSDVHEHHATEPAPAEVAMVWAAATAAAHPRTSDVAQAVTAAVATGAELHRELNAGAQRRRADARAAARSTPRGEAAGGGGPRRSPGGVWPPALRAGDERTAPLTAAVLFLGGLALHAEGRTNHPLCRPDSRWQAHAAWHALSAAALWLRTRPHPA